MSGRELADTFSDATSQIYNGQLNLQDDVQRASARNSKLLENCELEAKRTQLSLQRAASTIQTQIVTCSDNLIDRINGLEKSLTDRIASHPSNQITNVTKHFVDGQAHLDTRVDQLEKHNNNITLGMQQYTAAASDLLELKDMLALHFQDTQCTQASSRDPDGTARIMLTLTLPRLNITKQDLQILLRYLSAEVETVLRLCFAVFLVCLKDLLWALPQIIVICKILQRLPQAISLTLHDNMTFEDALGRVQSLQYQQFKHWTVFETSLRCTFADTPGMKKVLDGHFVLTTAAPARTLTASNWTQLVKPGLEIRMSIIIKTMSTAERQCPRGCAATDNIVSNGEVRCSHCGLYFSSERGHRRGPFAKPSPKLELASNSLDQPGIERSPDEAAQGGTVTPPTVTRSKDNNNQLPQDDHPAEDSSFDANETPVRVAGPIHYDKWFQERRVESEEIKAMKRVRLDYTDVDAMGAWSSETWTTSRSTFQESRPIDGKTGSRRKSAMITERRKRPKDYSDPFKAGPSFMLATHESPKALTCNVCLKHFSRKAVLDAHRMSHNLTCLQCGCQSETAEAYKAHESLHQEELEKRLNVVVSTTPTMSDVQFMGPMPIGDIYRSQMRANGAMQGPGAATGGNYVLQDYQTQPTLLDQQNKKQLMIAQQEQDNISRDPSMPGPGQFSDPNSPNQASNLDLSCLENDVLYDFDFNTFFSIDDWSD